ncbi:hypothetical protein OG203_43815 [Nocardia sp. NBC_01499]|uniref:hypothetical protein n=1 Tax=Nocardia sp. NBC_01499 TaxID=2903597 RepID=UPI00386FB518
MVLAHFVTRGSALLAGAAVAAGMATVGAGSAAAFPGQVQCGGPGYAQVCVKEEDSGNEASYWADTNFANGSECNVVVRLLDGDHTVFDTPSPCGSGYQSHRAGNLANPVAGHVYHSELEVHWAAGSVDHYRSPDLVFPAG